ncbi:hypothetical protein OUZ56_032125 [Daphnia magna]|uniref:Uncharacterized protein n=1 Tax=Daphnia magna TaxID=35525 RepID=A0ABQ9ZWA0_9CRUS|nr:hypothetical protein OUZ56_032125 [Daphnia magna]
MAIHLNLGMRYPTPTPSPSPVPHEFPNVSAPIIPISAPKRYQHPTSSTQAIECDDPTLGVVSLNAMFIGKVAPKKEQFMSVWAKIKKSHEKVNQTT